MRGSADGRAFLSGGGRLMPLPKPSRLQDLAPPSKEAGPHVSLLSLTVPQAARDKTGVDLNYAGMPLKFPADNNQTGFMDKVKGRLKDPDAAVHTGEDLILSYYDTAKDHFPDNKLLQGAGFALDAVNNGLFLMPHPIPKIIGAGLKANSFNLNNWLDNRKLSQNPEVAPQESHNE